jgi:hypothetical protein
MVIFLPDCSTFGCSEMGSGRGTVSFCGLEIEVELSTEVDVDEAEDLVNDACPVVIDTEDPVVVDVVVDDETSTRDDSWTVTVWMDAV